MSPRSRKLALTAHITASVGWLGAVGGFLSLAVAVLISHDAKSVRGAYVAMDLMARWVIVPLSFGSLLTGLVEALGTKWGLFQHYWVLAKLLINVFANTVLLIYLPSLNYMAAAALDTTSRVGDLGSMRNASPVLHSSAALVLLLLATGLGVYKPQGVTLYGWRKQQERLGASEA
ncbi:MAG: DUF2269 domain-containing protein [Gemmatimonadaceae bacterium]